MSELTDTILVLSSVAIFLIYRQKVKDEPVSETGSIGVNRADSHIRTLLDKGYTIWEDPLSFFQVW